MSEVVGSAKDLVRSEVDLITTEMRESSHRIGSHVGQAAVAGALLAVSVLPFIAFVVIGLGKIFGGNYWLSSLVVAIVCAVVGGPMARNAFRRMEEDMTFPSSREGMERAREAVREGVQDVSDASQRRAA